MAKQVLWEREPHTKAKHELLLAFFNSWLSIHSSTFAKFPRGGLVRVYDGFAGPGIYQGLEEGSPLILMRALLSNPNLEDRWKNVRYEFNFVEKDQARAARLKQELKRLALELSAEDRASPERISCTVTCGNYEDHVPQPSLGPSALFLFLDPFGYSHSPMTLTQDLVQQPKSDTLIFLPFSFVNRFVGRDGQGQAIDRFFGTPEWRNIANGTDRPARLLKLFLGQLEKVGLGWSGAFRLKPDPSNAYYIVGASGNPKGWTSIKEGFWKVDPVNGSEFAASPARVDVETLFALDEVATPQPNTQPLLDLLRATFSDRWFTIEQAIEVTARSRFLENRHLKELTLKPAERGGSLVVERRPGARQFKEGKGTRLRFR